MVEATDEFDAGPKLAAVIVEQLASAVQFPREELDRPTGTFVNQEAIRQEFFALLDRYLWNPTRSG